MEEEVFVPVLAPWAVCSVCPFLLYWNDGFRQNFQYFIPSSVLFFLVTKKLRLLQEHSCDLSFFCIFLAFQKSVYQLGPLLLIISQLWSRVSPLHVLVVILSLSVLLVFKQCFNSLNRREAFCSLNISIPYVKLYMVPKSHLHSLQRLTFWKLWEWCL